MKKLWTPIKTKFKLKVPQSQVSKSKGGKAMKFKTIVTAGKIKPLKLKKLKK